MWLSCGCLGAWRVGIRGSIFMFVMQLFESYGVIVFVNIEL